MVRLHDHIGQLQQLRRRVGLALEHVEGGVAEAALGQCLDEGGLVDHAAARDIDERAVRAERVDHGGRDEVARFRPALTRDHEIVAAPRQLDGIGDVVVGRIGLAAGPAIDHAHAQRGATIGDGAADAAEPEHPHGLAADAAPERDRALARPGALAHVAIGEQHLARGREHQADGEVGHFVRQNTWGIGDHDIALARGGEIDRIGSDPEDGDHFELWQRCDQRAVGAAIGLGRDRADAALEFGAQRIRRRPVEVMGDDEAVREFGVRRLGKRADAQYVDLHGRVKPRRPASRSCAGTRPGHRTR